MRLTTGAQLRAARGLLSLEKVQLARQTGVSIGTIKRLEGYDGRFDARVSTVDVLERFFAERGVSFIDGDEPGVRLRLPRAAA
jgi:predicted transcriptional regulator